MSAGAYHSDKELFARISRGDEKAFESIFHKYNAKLLPFVISITKNREVAEEILQEVFLKLWLKRGTLENIEEPAAWLVRLSSNMALTYLQRLAIHSKMVNKLNIPDRSDDRPEEAIDLKKVQEGIQMAVGLLPEKRQQVYLLSREQGLTRKEIAAQLDVSESTVKNQLTTALKFIQEYLEKNYGLYLPLILLLR